MQPKKALPERVALAGSKCAPVSNTEHQGPVDPDQEAEVTVYLKSKMSEADTQRLVYDLSERSIPGRKYLSREELAKQSGASPEDIARVEAFAGQYHLTVTKSDPGSRTISLRGKLGDLQQAFGVELSQYRAGGTSFRARSGSISLPAAVAPVIQGVFGLDTRPVAERR